VAGLPGGAISKRPLRFFWVLDVSTSMIGSKIGELNHAVKETLPAMKTVADDNPNAAVEVMVLTFATSTTWVTPAPVPLADFSWTDLGASGATSMGAAMKEMAIQLGTTNMPDRALPPVVVLVTDGAPTDDFGSGLRAFQQEAWAKHSIRLGIAIGADADLGTIRQFIDHAEIEPLVANNAEDLVKYIRWVSTQVLKAASAPASTPQGAATQSTQSAQSAVPAQPSQSAAPTVW
jgi:uncharacterized protein YegL